MTTEYIADQLDVVLLARYVGTGDRRMWYPGPFTATVEERILSKVHELNRRLMTNAKK